MNECKIMLTVYCVITFLQPIKVEHLYGVLKSDSADTKVNKLEPFNPDCKQSLFSLSRASPRYMTAEVGKLIFFVLAASLLLVNDMATLT